MAPARRSMRLQRTPSPADENQVSKPTRSMSEGKQNKSAKTTRPPLRRVSLSAQKLPTRKRGDKVIDLVPSPSKQNCNTRRSGRVLSEVKRNYKVDSERIDSSDEDVQYSDSESSDASSSSGDASTKSASRTPSPLDRSPIPIIRISTRRSFSIEVVSQNNVTPIRKAPPKRTCQTTPKRHLRATSPKTKLSSENSVCVNATPSRAKRGKKLNNLLDAIPESEAINCTTPVKLSARGNAFKQRIKCLTSPRNKKPKSTKNEFELLREELSQSRLPAELPCRENEFGAIKDFIVQNIKSGTSRSVYISGVPGTGKTATVKQVLRSLQKDSKLRFKLIEVSGMRVTDPNQIFTEIHYQLFDRVERLSSSRAARMLDRVFELTDVDRPPIVMLVDELDLLCTRKQHVLYQLFDWATRNEARLSIVAIANTLDLPERLLTQRVASRLGMVRLYFQPYNHTQIGEILRSRLGKSAVIESEAVELVSRKVASVSGDLRKALQICRRAIDLAIMQKENKLTLSLVQKAVKDLAGDSRCVAVQGCSRHEQIFLQASVREMTEYGREETQLNHIYPMYTDQCRFEGVQPLNIEETCHLLARLGALRLFNVERGRHDFTRKLRLSVPAEEIQFALKAAAAN